MSALDTHAILEALDRITDPCSAAMGRPIGIVGLGLIGEVQVEGDDVHIEMVLTDPSCAFYGPLTHAITDAVTSLGARNVDVTLAPDVVWTPDRLNTNLAEAHSS
jgi:metal-sulfur cluster biosynthetic enzyme